MTPSAILLRSMLGWQLATTANFGLFAALAQWWWQPEIGFYPVWWGAYLFFSMTHLALYLLFRGALKMTEVTA